MQRCPIGGVGKRAPIFWTGYPVRSCWPVSNHKYANPKAVSFINMIMYIHFSSYERVIIELRWYRRALLVIMCCTVFFCE